LTHGNSESDNASCHTSSRDGLGVSWRTKTRDCEATSPREGQVAVSTCAAELRFALTVEFHCSGCGKRLRTEDEAAGKSAKCPNCGKSLAVPELGPREAGPQAKTAPAPPRRATCPKCGAAKPPNASRCPRCKYDSEARRVVSDGEVERIISHKETIALLRDVFDEAFPRPFLPDDDFYGNWGGDDDSLVAMLGAILQWLRIDGRSVVAGFTPDLGSPGVFFRQGGTDFILVDASHRNDPFAAAAILAHESTHLLLSRLQLGCEDVLANELFTDLATIYTGLGIVILNGMKRKSYWHLTAMLALVGIAYTRREEAWFGYFNGRDYGTHLRKYLKGRGMPMEAVMGFVRPVSRPFLCGIVPPFVYHPERKTETVSALEKEAWLLFLGKAVLVAVVVGVVVMLAHSRKPPRTNTARRWRLPPSPSPLGKKPGWGGLGDLLESSAKGDVDRVRRLLDRGVSPNGIDGRAQTALHYAAAKGHKDVAALLVSRGADVNTTSKRGATPLHCAAGAGHRELVEFLISKGAHVDPVMEDGITPLAGAVFVGHTGCVAQLIESGANVNRRSLDGLACLHVAVSMGNERLVLLLIGKSADVNISSTPPQSATPLHIAAAGGGAEIAKALIDKGADVNRRAGNGGTPLDWAVQYKHDVVAELLKRCGGKSGGELPERVESKAPKGEIDQRYADAVLGAFHLQTKEFVNNVRPMMSNAGTGDEKMASLRRYAQSLGTMIKRLEGLNSDGVDPSLVDAGRGVIDAAKEAEKSVLRLLRDPSDPLAQGKVVVSGDRFGLQQTKFEQQVRKKGLAVYAEGKE